MLLHHRLLESLVAVLKHLLLDHVLVEHLVVELERLLVDQLVVETLAISRLNNVALGVDTVLIAHPSRGLMLTLELLFLFYSMRVVLNETPSRRYIELRHSTVVKLINGFIERVSVNILSFTLQLSIQFCELILNSLCLHFKLLVVELVLGPTINAELLGVIAVLLSCFPLHLDVVLLASTTVILAGASIT